MLLELKHFGYQNNFLSTVAKRKLRWLKCQKIEQCCAKFGGGKNIELGVRRKNLSPNFPTYLP